MKDYANAPDKELRKAWLKRKFLSYEYHEELVVLHAQWYEIIRKALERPEVKQNHPRSYEIFHRKYLPIFEAEVKPGQLDPNLWVPGKSAGVARSISDYNRYLGPEYWEWMLPEELEHLNNVRGKMNQIALNIRQTVDNLWFNPRKGNDDALLNERYTGPIDWPAHWEDVPKEAPKSVAGGQPCPRSGWWYSLAEPQTIQRYYFKEGETFPVFEGSRYGDTFWQWAHNQSDTQE